MPTNWIILTGEYPPQRGGVSDYTRLVAAALAEAGDPVDVFAPPIEETVPARDGVRVHRISDRFGRCGLRQIDRHLAQPDDASRLLLQYVPHAFGMRAMNLPFCGWLAARARRQPLDVMFHEVAYPFEGGQLFRRHFLAGVNHLMAMTLARAASRIFVSTSAWIPRLITLGASPDAIGLLPIPSNLASERSAQWRPTASGIVGHFGTYGSLLTPLLRDTLLRMPDARIRLLGRGSERFTAELVAMDPRFSDRIEASGALPDRELAIRLAECSVMLQPYPDGITTRRSSAIASLALGVPIVANEGSLTEPIWRKSGAVALAASTPAALAAEVKRVLGNAAEQSRFSLASKALYAREFAIENTIDKLRSGI